MRTLIKIVVILAVLGTLGWFGLTKGQQWLAERNKPRFRVASVERGDLRITVNAAGQLEPTLSVKIGSFVSGPILELLADHNDEVKADQLLARIDPRIYIASVQRDEAALGARQGDVARVQAELQRARNDEKRSAALKAEKITKKGKTTCDVPKELQNQELSGFDYLGSFQDNMQTVEKRCGRAN